MQAKTEGQSNYKKIKPQRDLRFYLILNLFA